MNDVIVNKAQSIQRCVKRAREEYTQAEDFYAMVGFRNIAVHAYQSLDMNIVASVIESNLSDIFTFADVILDLDE